MLEELAQTFVETEQITKLCRSQRKLLLAQQAALKLPQSTETRRRTACKQEGTRSGKLSPPDPRLGHERGLIYGERQRLLPAFALAHGGAFFD